MPYRHPAYQRPPGSYKTARRGDDNASLMHRIATAVGSALGVTLSDMQSPGRKEAVREARQIASALIRRRASWIGYRQIAAFFNQRHNSVLNAIRQIETLLEAKDAQITDKFQKAKKALKDENLHEDE